MRSKFGMPVKNIKEGQLLQSGKKAPYGYYNVASIEHLVDSRMFVIWLTNIRDNISICVNTNEDIVWESVEDVSENRELLTVLFEGESV